MQTESSVFDGDLDRLGVSSIWSFVKIKQQIRADWDKTLGRTKPGSIAKIDEDTPAPIKRIDQNKRPFIRRWMAVAAAVLLFALTWSLYNQVWNLGKAAENDVIAGGNRATLTLSGGRTVVLAEQSEGLMLDDSGVQIKKTDDGQLIYVLPDHDQLMAGNNGVMVYNTVTTPRTGRYSVVLPDGSVVTLNAAFSLRYPIRFDSKSREVELEGEAFFEVAKLETKNENDEFERVPFHVRTGNQDIHVLGTSFNVNAYKDEETTKTALVSGRVEVAHAEDPTKRIQLEPGYYAETQGAQLSSGLAHLESVTAWKDNYFYFHDQHISSILRQISRWYDVDFVYDEKVDIAGLYFTGSVSNTKNLSQVLRIMERTGMVKFSIEGRRVLVMD